MQTIQITSCKKIIKVLVLMCFLSLHTKQAIDYNGNPINNHGTITITPTTSPAVLASYTQAINMDGMIDQTFFFNPVTNGQANAALLQPDGKFIGLGANGANFQLVRYNSDGSIAPSFNVTTVIPGGANAAVLQPDGKSIAVGINAAATHFQLVRYNSDGSIDPTFNLNAIPTSRAFAAVLQPDNKIVAVGRDGAGHFQPARYINPFTLASFTASYGEVGML